MEHDYWNMNSRRLLLDVIRKLEEHEARLQEHDKMISKLNAIRKALVWVLEQSVENKAVGIGFVMGVALGWYLFS